MVSQSTRKVVTLKNEFQFRLSRFQFPVYKRAATFECQFSSPSLKKHTNMNKICEISVASTL